MSSYTDTLRYLYSLEGRGIKLGLRTIGALLRAAGNPERRFASVHVAGTNGKGSTSSFLASMTMEAGYKTGLYTSPHLVRFTERIRINGKEIPEERLVRYVRALRSAVESLRATFFEATTCIAFQYFADEEVDVAIVETGLGGRLDATNILRPLISVITNVSFDHTEYLGTTLKSIAREKGGVTKAGVPCVTSETKREVLDTLRRVALRRRTSLFRADRLVFVSNEDCHGNRLHASFETKHFRVRQVRIGLEGLHQVENARLALAAVELLCRQRGGPPLRITAGAIRRGMSRVRKNTRLSGRLQRLRRNRHLVLDVAHNPEATRILVEALKKQGMRNLPVMFGVMKDKDYITMLSYLKPLARVVIAVAPPTSRALATKALMRSLSRADISALEGRSVRRGLRIAQRIQRQGEPILVTGSHFVVGEVLKTLTKT